MKEAIIMFTTVFALGGLINRYQKKHHHDVPKEYCIVVKSVKYGKKSTVITAIQQDGKRRNRKFIFNNGGAYRYPSINIHPGDTVSVKKNWLVKGPNF
jgi:hypothetical protein